MDLHGSVSLEQFKLQTRADMAEGRLGNVEDCQDAMEDRQDAMEECQDRMDAALQEIETELKRHSRQMAKFEQK